VSTSASAKPAGAELPAGLPDRAGLARLVRVQLPSHLWDLSAGDPGEIAVYALSDPRELRVPRYIGQSAAPRRRLRQHIATARLYLPDARPWWIASPRLRPLYEWIRALFRDEGRLPVMTVLEWVSLGEARVAERRRICECLERQLPLLNHEYELLRRQLQLI